MDVQKPIIFVMIHYIKKNAELLEQFKKAFHGIEFYITSSLGEQNAAITMDALGIETQFPYIEIVKECGQQLYALYQNLLNGKLPKIDILRGKIVHSISEYVNYTINDETINTDDENDELYTLNEKYKWEERCDDLNINSIIEYISKKKASSKNQKIKDKKKKISSKQRDELKKFLNDLNCPNSIKSLSSFSKEWVIERKKNY